MIDVNIALPLDKLGTASSNLVQNEQCPLLNRDVNAIVPEYGAFFAKSLSITDANGTPLTTSQYRAGEMVTKATRLYGQRVCDIILITDPSLHGFVTIKYQALGGELSYSKKKLKALLDSLDLDNRTVDWDDILDRPLEFQPDPAHLTNTTQVYGTEYLEAAILRTARAISIGDSASHKAITAYINSVIANATTSGSAANQMQMALHKAAADPHTQYVQKNDVYSLLSVVRQPINLSPAAAAANVGLNVPLVASPYYTLYGLAQGSAHFQVSTVSDFSSGLIVDAVVSGAATQYQPSTLFLPNTTYFWRVMYLDSENAQSAWSGVTSFVTANIMVAQPSILNPVANQPTNTEAPLLQTSAFAVVGDTDTHLATDWEIWSAPNSTGIRIWSSLGDTVNKTTFQLPTGLFTRDTNYYLRARHKGTKYGYSDWSTECVFDATWPLRPTVIGQPFGGGYYAGDYTFGGATYAIIVAPKASGEMTGALTTTIASAANTSVDDSVANTTALPNTAAVAWVKSLAIGGFTDWCIPAKGVLNVIATNLKPTLTTIPTNFKTGGTDAFAAANYWSSSAYNWVNTYTDASTPNYANVNHVDCSYSASGWYGPSDATGPAASCSRGTVSNYTVGYYYSINPSTGQPGSLNTSHWCCNYTSLDIVSYTPGATHNDPYYYAWYQNMSTAAVSNTARNNATIRARAIRMVRVA